MTDILGIFIMVALLAPWMQHIYTCLTTDRWGFLIAGAVVFPIAWVHGVLIWMGVA